MKLQDYLRKKSLSPAQFANQLGKPASTITRLIKGERDPGMALLREIAEATNGAVTPNDFLHSDHGEVPKSTPHDHLSHSGRGGKRGH